MMSRRVETVLRINRDLALSHDLQDIVNLYGFGLGETREINEYLANRNAQMIDYA